MIEHRQDGDETAFLHLVKVFNEETRQYEPMVYEDGTTEHCWSQDLLDTPLSTLPPNTPYQIVSVWRLRNHAPASHVCSITDPGDWDVIIRIRKENEELAAQGLIGPSVRKRASGRS